MDQNLINRIAATIRRVDGDHTLGAAALASAIAADLESIGYTDELLTENARLRATLYRIATAATEATREFESAGARTQAQLTRSVAAVAREALAVD